MLQKLNIIREKYSNGFCCIVAIGLTIMTFFLQMKGHESFSYYSGNRNRIINYPLGSNYVVAGILLLLNFKRTWISLFLSKLKYLIKSWRLVVWLFFLLIHGCKSKQEKLEDFIEDPKNLLVQKRKIGTWSLELRYLIPGPKALNDDANLGFSFTVKNLESKSNLRIVDSSFDRKVASLFSIVTTKDTMFPVEVFRNYNAPPNVWEYRLSFKEGNFILFLFNDKAFTDSLVKFNLNAKAIVRVNEFAE
jgi:hypothetical protein